MVTRLLERKADPNVPATDSYRTPLDYLNNQLAGHQDIRDRLGGWDDVKKLPNYMVYVEPDSTGYQACKDLILKAGGVSGACIPPDGFVYGKPDSKLRSYVPGPEGSYTAADVEKSGLYIRVTEEMLLERKKKEYVAT